MRHVARRIVQGLAAALVLTAAPSAQAQDYPSRDITFIVPFNPGGSSDPLSRAFAAQLEKALSRNVNVENKPGGSATIGTNLVVRANPDGYTIGLGDSAALMYQPLVNKDLAYKTTDDYEIITKLADVPGMLVVRPDAPWNTFEEFLADVKKSPGKIRVGVSGVRSISDMVVQQFNRAADVKITTVPFTGGGGEALLAVMGGRIEGAVGYGGNTIAQIEAGKLKVLGVFAKGKYEPVPNAMSIPDAGYNATIPSGYSVIAPKGLPNDVREKLVAASQEAVRSPEFKEFTKKNGFVLDLKSPHEVSAELGELRNEFVGLIEWLDKKSAAK
ncbi:Bug family tripartite tricarboxylate transporter substrate binding protein [Microvirga vignae]|uniref:Bug family tripartite tricarboxylate transporter substrate binding protein n=1 Tax=Microvirga vignae TaxID=1225564 RepID=UPI000A0471F9|nr:tripartite tricarboxylate transporter substrate binding protein [Microvirga vignae]